MDSLRGVGGFIKQRYQAVTKKMEKILPKKKDKTTASDTDTTTTKIKTTWKERIAPRPPNLMASDIKATTYAKNQNKPSQVFAENVTHKQVDNQEISIPVSHTPGMTPRQKQAHALNFLGGLLAKSSEVGIFRIPGKATIIDDRFECYNHKKQGKIDKFYEETQYDKHNIYNASDLYKKILGEEKLKLITGEHKENFKKIGQDETENKDRLQLAITFLNNLPEEEKQIFVSTLNLLRACSEKTGIKMDANNLARVIAPNLTDDTNVLSSDVQKALQFCIENWDQIKLPRDIQYLALQNMAGKLKQEVNTGGIFRVPGTNMENNYSSLVEDNRDALIQNKDVPLPDDTQELASLFKKVLRENPVIQDINKANFLKLGECKTEKDVLKIVNNLELNSNELNILITLLDLLDEVIKKDINQMDVKNLAICIAPNIAVEDKSLDALGKINEADMNLKAFTTLLKHREAVIDALKSKLSPPTSTSSTASKISTSEETDRALTSSLPSLEETEISGLFDEGSKSEEESSESRVESSEESSDSRVESSEDESTRR